LFDRTKKDEKTSGIEYCRQEVGALEAEAGKSLADMVALNIGQIGENMALGDVNFFTSHQGRAGHGGIF
jgi:hypothetical protein